MSSALKLIQLPLAKIFHIIPEIHFMIIASVDICEKWIEHFRLLATIRQRFQQKKLHSSVFTPKSPQVALFVSFSLSESQLCVKSFIVLTTMT